MGAGVGLDDVAHQPEAARADFVTPIPAAARAFVDSVLCSDPSRVIANGRAALPTLSVVLVLHSRCRRVIDLHRRRLIVSVAVALSTIAARGVGTTVTPCWVSSEIEVLALKPRVGLITEQGPSWRPLDRAAGVRPVRRQLGCPVGVN